MKNKSKMGECEMQYYCFIKQQKPFIYIQSAPNVRYCAYVFRKMNEQRMNKTAPCNDVWKFLKEIGFVLSGKTLLTK